MCALGAWPAWVPGPSTSPLGATVRLLSKLLTAAASSALGVILSCTSASLTAAPSTSPIQVSICTLAAHPDTYDEKVVLVRTALDYGVEYTRLYDTDCPDTSVFARSKSGVNLFCPTDVLEKYGCPINFATGVRVNLTGTFHRYKDKGGGRGTLDVDSMAVVAPTMAPNNRWRGP